MADFRQLRHDLAVKGGDLLVDVLRQMLAGKVCPFVRLVRVLLGSDFGLGNFRTTTLRQYHTRGAAHRVRRFTSRLLGDDSRGNQPAVSRCLACRPLLFYLRFIVLR